MLLVAPLQELARWVIPLAFIFVTGFGDPIRTAITGAGAIALIGWVSCAVPHDHVPGHPQQGRSSVCREPVDLGAPLDRVRSVDVTAPFLHRLLGLGKLVIGTGKADTRRNRDLVLDGLTLADAERLRGELLHRATTASDSPAVTLEKSTAADVELVRLRPRWLFYAPFTRRVPSPGW